MSDLIYTASEFAAREHHGQFRKDGKTPYIVHPARVAMILAAEQFQYTTHAGGMPRDEILAVAWMHDLLEDTDVTFAEIRELFPVRVLNAVQDLTNNKLLKLEAKVSRVERKSIDRVRLAAAREEVRFIKLADRLDNVMDLSDYDKDFQYMYAGETDLLVRELLRDGMHNAGVNIVKQIRERIALLL